MRVVLAICISALAIAVVAVEFDMRQIARADGPLEPSLLNEADHAVARAEAWLRLHPPQCTNAVPGDILGTNGLAAADTAIRLVSSQKGAGWWVTPTNAAPTMLAIQILKGL